MSVLESSCEVHASAFSAEREQLLLEQLPQVRFLARRIHDRLPQHVEFDDLMHAGVLGLIDALKKFDSRKQVQFKSYAQFRIRGAILDSLRELDWGPRELRKKARRIEEAHRTLSFQFGRNATEQEVADEIGTSLTDYQRLLGELRGLDLGSIQAEPDDGSREDELYRYVPDETQEDPFCLCLRSEMKLILVRALEELPERDRQVLALYYFEELPMKAIGEVMGVVESRVSQIHTAAVLRLRLKLKELRPKKAQVDTKSKRLKQALRM